MTEWKIIKESVNNDLIKIVNRESTNLIRTVLYDVQNETQENIII